MRWLAVMGTLAACLAGPAQAGEWLRIETGDTTEGWGIDRASVTRTPQGIVRAWFIRAIPPIGEDSPEYRLQLEAFDCARYVRVTETVTDYQIESYGVFPEGRRTPNERENVAPGTLGYAMLDAACNGRADGPSQWSEQTFLEAFRRDWARQNYDDQPDFQIGDFAPVCFNATRDCEIWDRNWRGRGLAEGATVYPSSYRVVAEY